ncbi:MULTISPECIES: GGDEF domain-containing protein [Aliiglaciecola]|uniref:GGDEF domain-containing protein n=1 Tax=Aliiglaciecola TaxID=1406885 RepID=UPI001C0A1ED4|nr:MULTISPECIES: GGDEF domain-containing protein [Aliiglaciecola]MBU2877653.1 GGDEF domain-containing protein [Aliiglaciecola lipolytica]MDO6713186.1 GGDEF domain-containing protein [Aliiglaciecola sp. 2_MG-2023]MDO6754266.1 GGDEF domain-containing protein [Aliiglaciecola sp. 1_MG-2023]
MSAKDIEQSFVILKQTVPLLVKHKISAVPTNYALWYTYVSNDSPELNEQLDAAVESDSPISELKAKDLYRSYISDKEEVNVWDLRQSLEGMMIELSQSLKDTKSETQDYKNLMDACIDDLSKVEKEGWTVEEVLGLVRNMVKESQVIRQSTISFNGALASAEKEIVRLKSQLQASQQEALYDALTGLCNRRYFDSEISSKTKLDKCSLALIDIDHFKKINDTYGHQMGDLVLKAVAKKIQSCCRENAQAFRYGGEEFAVIMPGLDQSRARHMADVMRRNIEKITVKDRRTGQSLGDITVSAGVAQLQANEHSSQFIETADKLLYEAKRLGRNRVMPMA